MRALAAAFCVAATVAWGGDPFRDADVVFLGEVHDNPAHHARQAQLVAEIAPAALVFEMLTAEQAAAVAGDRFFDEKSLSRALRWDTGGWPDFSLYYPIFAAAPRAHIYGAGLPREAARAALDGPVSTSFGPDAAAFGLTDPLPPAEQARREVDQAQAHCNALPEELLPAMVAVQRLRDAVIARAARDAVAATGGPVVVITGNGHARRDRGAPVALARAAPGLRLATLGQGERGAGPPDGVFDVVEYAPAPPRGDPCAALR